MNLFLELLAVAALILLNAFFVAAEYGLVTSRRTRIVELEREGNRRAKTVLQVVSDPPRFIAAMQLGVTLTSLAIRALGDHALTRPFGPVVATAPAVTLAVPPEEALRAVMDSPYTRYPVYRGSLDDIVGILHVRDLFQALVDRGLAAVEVEQLVRPAYVVPETKDLAALLTEFRRTNQHMAIVIDEYGGMEGIVTLEDLLEEIVGEIEDEFDLPDESVEQVDEDTIRIDGTFPIDDFNEQFQT